MEHRCALKTLSSTLTLTGRAELVAQASFLTRARAQRTHRIAKDGRWGGIVSFLVNMRVVKDGIRIGILSEV